MAIYYIYVGDQIATVYIALTCFELLNFYLCPISFYTHYMTLQHAAFFLHKAPIHHTELYEHYSMLTLVYTYIA